MNPTIQRILLPSKARRRTVGVAIWLLRLVREAEYDDMLRYSDSLDDSDYDSDRAAYLAIEDGYIISGHAWSTLESAIEDLEYVY